jgi:hypothetical protein
MTNYANHLRSAGHHAQALALYEEALECFKRGVPEIPSHIGVLSW